MKEYISVILLGMCFTFTTSAFAQSTNYLDVKKDFGAQGNCYDPTGVECADDTQALVAAFAKAKSSNLPVFIPTGRYKYTSSLFSSNTYPALNVNSITVYGTGENSVLVHFAALDPTIKTQPGYWNPNFVQSAIQLSGNNPTLENIKIEIHPLEEGSRQPQNQTCVPGQNVPFCCSIAVPTVTDPNPEPAPEVGAVDHCRATVPQAAAVYVTQGTTNYTLKGLDIEGSQDDGVDIDLASQGKVIGNTINNVLAAGIQVDNGFNLTDVTNVPNGCSGLDIKGNTVTNTQDDMIAVVSDELKNANGQIVSSPCSNMTIHNNTVQGNNHGRGIVFEGVNGGTISGNSISNVFETAIEVAAENGYYVAPASSNIVVTNNTITNSNTSNQYGHDYGAINIDGTDAATKNIAANSPSQSDDTTPKLVENVQVLNNSLTQPNYALAMIVTNFAQSVTIKGNKFTQVNSDPSQVYGLFANQDSGLTAVNNQFMNLNDYGAFLGATSYDTFTGLPSVGLLSGNITFEQNVFQAGAAENPGILENQIHCYSQSNLTNAVINIPVTGKQANQFLSPNGESVTQNTVCR